uniref:Uncharacterized protein n=1 Tax=Acrobeloides nanus TaxID=290746 RepID=A0A914DHY2_9BILA
MAPFRSTTKDVQIKGYFIPKNTAIGPQGSIVLHDEKYSVIPEKPPTLERQMGAGNPPFPFVCKIEDRFGKFK